MKALITTRKGRPKMLKKNRPKVVSSVTYQNRCGCGDIFVTCSDHQGSLFEVFAVLGKAGGCGQANKTSVGKLISVALRSGTEPKSIIKAIEGVSCHKASTTTPSCIDAIALAIKEHVGKAS
jgi:ribonucleoside-diphosphate reductase alpha chain